jgi:hypothetical protein
MLQILIISYPIYDLLIQNKYYVINIQMISDVILIKSSVFDI